MTGQAEMAREVVEFLTDFDITVADLLDSLAACGFALVDLSGYENPAALAYLKEIMPPPREVAS